MLSFQNWAAGDPLHDYADHVTGFPLVDDPDFDRDDSPDVPLDWPRRFPHHPSFGPRSTVSVPVPSVFPSVVPLEVGPVLSVPDPPVPDPSGPEALDVFSSADTSLMPDDASSASNSSAEGLPSPDYSVRDHDKDLSRGMGHHLRSSVVSCFCFTVGVITPVAPSQATWFYDRGFCCSWSSRPCVSAMVLRTRRFPSFYDFPVSTDILPR